MSKMTTFEQLRLLALKCYSHTAAKILELTNAVSAALEEIPTTIKSSGTFDGLAWESVGDGTYTQTISVDGVTADNDVLVSPTNEYREIYESMGCRCIAQAENSLTFECIDPQDAAIVIEAIIYTFQQE